jgi:ABC-type multidrug transport system fused ATPase/permease subunit
MLQDEPLIKSPAIRILDPNGLKSHPELNEVQFEDVSFAYPINKEYKVLRNFKLHISKGLTVALVGHSGSLNLYLNP